MPPPSVVHWVDIIGGEILATDPATGVTTARTYPEMVGAVAQRTDGGLVAAVATGFVGFGPDGEIDHRVDCLPDGVRMNDAKTDPAGRYWSGSCAMDFAAGRGGLWRLDDDFEATLVLPNLTQPNGMDWSPSGDTFYLVETQARQILSFGFDLATGSIESQRLGPRGRRRLPRLSGRALRRLPRAHLGRGVRRLRRARVHARRRAGAHRADPGLADHVLRVRRSRPRRALGHLRGVGIDPDVDPDAGSTFRVTGLGVTGRASTPFRC